MTDPLEQEKSMSITTTSNNHCPNKETKELEKETPEKKKRKKNFFEKNFSARQLYAAACFCDMASAAMNPNNPEPLSPAQYQADINMLFTDAATWREWCIESTWCIHEDEFTLVSGAQ